MSEWPSDCVSKWVSHPTCRARSLASQVVEQKNWPSNLFWRAGKGPNSQNPPTPPLHRTPKLCRLCYIAIYYARPIGKDYCRQIALFIDQLFPEAETNHAADTTPCLLPHSQDQRVMRKWYLAELRKALSADSFRNIIMYLRQILPIMWHNDCNVLILYFSDNQNMRLHVWALPWEQDPKIQGSSGIATRVDPKVTGFC